MSDMLLYSSPIDESRISGYWSESITSYTSESGEFLGQEPAILSSLDPALSSHHENHDATSDPSSIIAGRAQSGPEKVKARNKSTASSIPQPQFIAGNSIITSATPELRSRVERINLLVQEKTTSTIKGRRVCGRGCSEAFTSLVDLAHHLDEKHPSEYRPYRCSAEDCVWHIIGFHKRSEALRHYMTIHDHTESKHGCSTCGRTYNRLDGLKRHQRSLHLSVPPKSNKRDRDCKEDYLSHGQRVQRGTRERAKMATNR